MSEANRGYGDGIGTVGQRMSSRAWVIAAQGAAVALLVSAVYITLLRDDSPMPLPEIQAPGAEHAPGSKQQAQTPGVQAPGSKQQAQTPGPGGAGGGASLTGSIGASTAAGGVPTGTGVGGESPAFTGPTPPVDQYGDAVSGLLSRVHSAPGASPASDR